MSVLVVGSVAYDSVETPFGRADDVLGGSGTFFSIAASHFTEPRVVAVVGEDFRAADRQTLVAHGVDLTGLETQPGQCFRWSGRYEADGINRSTLYTHLNVFEHFRPQIPAVWRDSPHVFLANIDPRLQLTVLDQVEAPRCVALDTMDLWIATRPQALAEVIRRVHILFVNDAETRALTGEHTMRRAAAALQAMGPQTIVIKRGEHGALLFHGEEVFLAPALPLATVVDPTGAGDTFAGGFLGYVAGRGCHDGATLRQAMAVGTVMASFCVESFSVERLSQVQRSEIEARIAALADMTCFAPPTLPSR
jgi:sugar/nucleoside kinase (ribokinase family)